jgi:hypothetical protein
VNGVVDFFHARARPWKNGQTGQSSQACRGGSLKSVLRKNVEMSGYPNDPKIALRDASHGVPRIPNAPLGALINATPFRKKKSEGALTVLISIKAEQYVF